MAITVGELLVAIQADDTPLRRALADVDRLSKGYADRASFYQKSVTEARNATRDAQKALNGEQRNYNRLLEASNSRAKKGIQNTKEQNLALLERFQATRKAERNLRSSEAGLSEAISLRDENRLEKQRAAERLRGVRAVQSVEREITDDKEAENRQTSDEMMARRRMEKSANADLNTQRRGALRDIANEEARIAGDRARVDRVQLAGRRSSIIEQLQEREELERGIQRRIAEGDRNAERDKQRLRRRNAVEYENWWKRTLDERDPRPTRPPRNPRQQRGRRQPQFQGGGLGMFGITSTLVATAGLAELGRTANEMQVIQQRLAQVSASGQEAAVAFNRLAEGSQRLRQPLSETVELYTKLRQSNENVGMSANETIKVTEAFSAALRISGATGQSASSSLLQFGQAMAKGKLDGDEFRTVAENASEVLRVLERQTGKSRGELLKMREEGKLTAKMMADSLIREYDNLIERSTKLAPSLSQGATSLKNSLLIAMTNTASARDAIEKLATRMVELADLIKDNGPLLYGLAQFALGVLAVAAAFKTLKLAQEAWMVIRGAGVFGPVAAGAAATVLAINAYGKAHYGAIEAANDAEIIQTQKLNDANKIREKIVGRVMAAQEKLQKIQARGKWAGPMALASAKEKLAYEMGQLKKAGEQMVALRAMSDKASVTTADAPSEKKKGKGKDSDPITEYLQKLADLRDANKLRVEDARAAIDMVATEEAVFADKTTTMDRYILALKRLELAQKIGFMTSLDVNKSMQDGKIPMEERIDAAVDLAEGYQLLSKEAKKSALEEIKYILMVLKAKLHSEDDLNKKIELAKKYDKIQKEMAASNAFGVGTGAAVGDSQEEKMTMLERHFRNLERSLIDMGLSAPGDLFTTYFDAMVESVETGTNRVGEAMRSKLGSMMKDAGKNMIEMGMTKFAQFFTKKYRAMIGNMVTAMAGPTMVLGKFLTAIKKALANPLVAGFALVAIGVAMAAYGAKMGAIGKGGGSAELAGGIGGLGTGGQELTQRYSFADRRNPLEGNRVVGMPQQSITVNQTIIGANDPIAQRQIGDLVNNAARRGIIRGSV